MYSMKIDTAQEAGVSKFSEDEMEAAYSQMTADNQIHISDDKIMLIWKQFVIYFQIPFQIFYTF